jgi:hypothetical protein
MTDYQFCMINPDGQSRIITVGAQDRAHAHDMFDRIYGTDTPAFLYQQAPAFVQELVDKA